MASLIYDSCLRDLQIGSIDADADTFKAMLVTSSYTANKGTHAKRSDITNEVAAGGGYTAGGATCACTAALNTTSHVMVLTFAAVSWATSTITARGMVVYKSRGGASSADELVGFLDFGSNISSAGGTFSVAASTLTTTNS
jgi:hypothetical protein